jgi:hypothetical protein
MKPSVEQRSASVPSARRHVGPAARELGRRLATAGGAAVALLALLNHAPLLLACASGAATLLALSLGARLGGLALESALEADRRAQLLREEQP